MLIWSTTYRPVCAAEANGGGMHGVLRRWCVRADRNVIVLSSKISDEGVNTLWILALM